MHVTRVFLTSLTLLSCVATAQESNSTPDSDKLAKELSNPATSLSTLNFNHETFSGENGVQKQTLSFQPSFPIKLKNGSTLGIRPLIGMTKSTDAQGNDATHFNNLGLDVVYGRAFSNGMVFTAGVYTQAPTSTADGASDQWLTGPELLLGKLFAKGIAGTFIYHATDLGGSDEFSDVDQTNIQYLYSYGLGNGWQLSASPTITYDWNYSDADYAQRMGLTNAWSIPLGVGISKTTKLGKTPIKVGVEAHYYTVKSSDTAPDTLLKLKIAPVVKNPLQF